MEAGKENKEGEIRAESIGEDTESQDDEKIGLLDDYPLDEVRLLEVFFLIWR